MLARFGCSDHGILSGSSFVGSHGIASIPDRAGRILSRISRSTNSGVESRAAAHKMCIIDRWHNAHHTSASRVHMTKIITQCLDIVHREFILVNQDGVVSGTRSPLQSRMRKQVEIIELRVDNVGVDNCASGTISGAIRVAAFSGEETCMVTFCDNDEGDVGTVAFFEGLAGGPDGFDFRVDDMGELTFGDSITEEQDAFWFGFGLLIECLTISIRCTGSYLEQFDSHGFEIRDYLNSRALSAQRSRVTTGARVHTGNNGTERWTKGISRSRVIDVSTHDNLRLIVLRKDDTVGLSDTKGI